LNFDRFVGINVIKDVLERLRAMMEIFEDFVGFLDFAAVLPDAIDAVQVLCWIEHRVT